MAAYQYVYHMSGVSKAYPGGKKCFENINLNFLPGVKIGVVGVNGSGKSTLMKIMAGMDKDFTGEAWHAEGAKVGYLPQEPKLDETLTVRENVMLGVAKKKAVLDRYNELAMNYSDETADEMGKLQDQIDAEEPLGSRFAQIDVSAWRPCAAPPMTLTSPTLSGGEARRVALCKLLLEAPDMLLLDEPTNHLDAETIAWLQQHLIDYKGTILIVTHDRYFLDDITGMDPGTGTRPRHSLRRQLFLMAGTKGQTPAARSPRRQIASERHWNANWNGCAKGPRPVRPNPKARISAYNEMAETVRARETDLRPDRHPQRPALGKQGDRGDEPEKSTWATSC